MTAVRSLLLPLGLGAAFGAVDSAVNALSSPAAGPGEDAAWTSIARVLGFLLDAGWAWAALAVAAGWRAGGRTRGAVAGAAALLAATTAYYLMDSCLRDEPFTWYLSELGYWWLASLVLGSALGWVGAHIGRPGVVGLVAGLVVPVGAAVQMAVLAPGLDGLVVHPEARWARSIVWVGAAFTAALVVVRSARVQRATQPAGQP